MDRVKKYVFINYNVRTLIVFFYIIIPLLFYAVPLFFLYKGGNFTVHFYSTLHIDYHAAFSVLLGHISLGFLVFFVLNSTGYNIFFCRRNILYDFTTVIVLMLVVFFGGFVSMLLWGAFYVLISNVRLSKITYFFLIIIGVFNLLYYGERGVLIFIILAFFISYISRMNYSRLFVIGFLGMFFLVYILQPLKYGNIPLSGFSDSNDGFKYLLQHLFPIYYTAYLSNELYFSVSSLFAEFIPFAKSLLNDVGVVERLAIEGLPSDIINSGGRLGSNSAMYFSIVGVGVLIVMFIIIAFNIHILKSQILVNSYLTYFVIQGPYFIRRSFASFTIDLIVITFWVFLISFVLSLIKSRIISNE